MTPSCVLIEILKHKLFDILRSKEGVILTLGELMKYYIRKIFIRKYADNVPQEILPDFYLILLNNLNYSQCIKEPIL